MTHISRRKLPRKTQKAILQSFYWVFNALSKEKEIDDFLNSLFTETEKVMLAKRLALALLLAEGQSNQAIAEALNLTRITVAKFRAETEAGKYVGLQKALKKLAHRERMQEFKKFLLQVAARAVRHAGGLI